MIITVNRFLKGITLSVVEVNQQLFAYGIEPADPIPAGSYPVTWYLSPKHGFYVPLVENVPGHQGIEIHVGNTAKDTRDCLCLGYSLFSRSNIIYSKPAIAEFYKNFKLDFDDGKKSVIIYHDMY